MQGRWLDGILHAEWICVPGFYLFQSLIFFIRHAKRLKNFQQVLNWDKIWEETSVDCLCSLSLFMTCADETEAGVADELGH